MEFRVPGRAMAFKVGDRVVYPHHGAAVIEKKEKRKAFGEEKNARYKAALKRFVDEWADHEISAWARADWAHVLHNENELAVQANSGGRSVYENIGPTRRRGAELPGRAAETEMVSPHRRREFRAGGLQIPPISTPPRVRGYRIAQTSGSRSSAATP